MLHPLHTSKPLSQRSNAPVWQPQATLTPEMRNGQQHHGTAGKQYGTGWESEIGRQYFDSVKKRGGVGNQSVKEEQFVTWKSAKVVNKPLTLYLLWGCYFTEWPNFICRNTHARYSATTCFIHLLNTTTNLWSPAEKSWHPRFLLNDACSSCGASGSVFFSFHIV